MTTGSGALEHDYGTPSGTAEWLRVDWQAHLKQVRIGGTRVNLVDIGESAAGDPAVVMIHGLGGSWHNWLENIPHFAADHRVIAMDLPGFGRSDMPRDDLSITGYGECMIELLDELGVDHAVIIGNSMGGFVGAEMAIKHPDRVDKLVLVSAAAFWQENWHARPTVAFARATKVGFAFVAGHLDWAVKRPRSRLAVWAATGIARYPHRIAPELVRELILGAENREGFTQAVEALSTYPIREELPQISCPTLIVWGSDDRLVSVRDADEYERLIPNARKLIYERTGHMAMLERPRRFHRDVDEFFAEHAGTDRSDASDASAAAVSG